MVQLLRYIKNNFPLLWEIAESFNGCLVSILQKDIVDIVERTVISFGEMKGMRFSRCRVDDVKRCHSFFTNLDFEERRFFKPFPVSMRSIKHVLSCPTYLFFMVEEADSVAGVFFLRISANKRAFLGFAVRRESRGQGIGACMLKALSNACTTAHIELFSTVSIENVPSWKAHLSSGFTVARVIDETYRELRFSRSVDEN